SDLAEAARARAAVAVDHERGGALTPTLEDVRAARLLADGDEVERAHRLLEVEEVGAHASPRPEPLGLARTELETDGAHAVTIEGRGHVLALDGTVGRPPLAGAACHCLDNV